MWQRLTVFPSIDILNPRQNGAIQQTTFSYSFSCTKILVFFTEIFLSVTIKIYLHWFRNWLGAEQATSHNKTHDDLVYFTRVLFVQHPREQGEWLRQNPSVLT